MKIAEYIELVKQAETPQNGRIPTPPPFEGRVEPTNPGPPPIIRKVPVESIPFVSPANSEANIAKETFVTDNGRLPATPVRDRATGMLRMPYTAEDYGVHFGRLDGTKGIFSKINPNLAFLEGTYIEPPFPLNSTPSVFERKPLSPRGFISSPTRTVTPTSARLARLGANALKAVGNTPTELINSINAPARFIDTSGLGLTFSLLEPAQTAKSRAELDAYDFIRRNGFTPTENIKFPLGFELNTHPAALSYYPYLFGEYLKESPQILPTFASFSGPAAPVAILSDMGINTPYKLMTGSNDNLLPGFWHAQGRPTRARSNREYEEEENDMSRLGELLPGILKINDKQYGLGNLFADSAGGYLDPVFQWPFGFLYRHNMSNLAKLMDKPNAVYTDEQGNTTVDYRDLFSNIFGSKGVYEQEGGRPELRYLSENDKYWHVDKLKEAAAKMGYTNDEINNAVLLYDNPNSLLYKGANLLTLMGMPAKDIYNSIHMTDIPNEPDSSIPRYLPYNYTGGPALGVPQDNPKWIRVKRQLLRRLGDQETLFKINPFFKSLKGSTNQLTPEEDEFLRNPENILSLESFPTRGLIRSWNTDTDLPDISSLKSLRESIGNLKNIINTYNGPNDPYIQGIQKQLNKKVNDYDKLKASYEQAYYLNRIARLPYNYRYAYLIDHPDLIQPFLDKYYTNEETKQRINNFLNPE